MGQEAGRGAVSYLCLGDKRQDLPGAPWARAGDGQHPPASQSAHVPGDETCGLVRGWVVRSRAQAKVG